MNSNAGRAPAVAGAPLQHDRLPYQLIAFDLDGTVLDSAGQMQPGTQAALEKAGRAGLMLVVNTGRARSMIPHQVEALPYLRYVVSDSGAVITDLAEGRVLRVLQFEKLLARRLASMGKAGGAGVNVSLGSRHYFEWKTLLMHRSAMREEGLKMPPFNRMMKMLGETRMVVSAQRVLRAAKDPIMKLECVYSTRALAQQQLKAFQRMEGIEPVPALGGSIEITATGATKGQALAFLCRRHSIDPAQVMVFGDSGNDLSMRAHAGCFVAMGNAGDEVKAVADYVAETVEKDGVGKALHALLGL